MSTLLRIVAFALIATVAGFLFGVVSKETVAAVAFVSAVVTPGLYILSSTGETARRFGVRSTSHGW